jgi:hypothetical protein
MKTYGEWSYSSAILVWALDESERSASLPGCLTLGERAPGAHWIGGWVGFKGGLDSTEKKKSLDHAGNRNPAVQFIANRYINRVTPAR